MLDLIPELNGCLGRRGGGEGCWQGDGTHLKLGVGSRGRGAVFKGGLQYICKYICYSSSRLPEKICVCV